VSKAKDKRILLGMLMIFCLIQSLALCLNIQFFNSNNYLPSSFFYVKSDTFMDLFHLMYWSGNDGRYTDWSSVYPPLVFIIVGGIKAIFLGATDFNDGFDIRNASFIIELFLLFLFITVPYLVVITNAWKLFSRYEKFFLFVGFLLSTPLLFAFERGNIIIITLILLALVISQVGIYRCIYIALLINIKPYFVLLTLLFLVKRKWSDFTFCIGASGAIFLITGVMLDHNFLLFFENILHFSSTTDIFSLREVSSMPSSISAYSVILNSSSFQSSHLSNFLSNLQTLANIIELSKWLIFIMVLSVLFRVQKKINDAQCIGIIVVLISNLGTWVGGYTLILYFTLIPIFWAMRFKWAYLCILGLIFSSLNIYPLVADMNIGTQYSYLSDTFVAVNWSLDINNVIKPILNIFLLLLLTYEIGFIKVQINPTISNIHNLDTEDV
jgi:hypothetical protein